MTVLGTVLDAFWAVIYWLGLALSRLFLPRWARGRAAHRHALSRSRGFVLAVSTGVPAEVIQRLRELESSFQLEIESSERPLSLFQARPMVVLLFNEEPLLVLNSHLMADASTMLFLLQEAINARGRHIDAEPAARLTPVEQSRVLRQEQDMELEKALLVDRQRHAAVEANKALAQERVQRKESREATERLQKQLTQESRAESRGAMRRSIKHFLGGRVDATVRIACRYGSTRIVQSFFETDVLSDVLKWIESSPEVDLPLVYKLHCPVWKDTITISSAEHTNGHGETLFALDMTPSAVVSVIPL
ncbi:MAG: hypothetical protein KVP17_004814 [Porospora cf. gigantea B]|uniref:uncharacterized protein n=1 Tax=Porospora cf. gigantea B TaxID=2853592 RepID=UPI003571A37F|nr:MAG: hypothetical protein KVP17_004814 [Porospora cf. gigantea B]